MKKILFLMPLFLMILFINNVSAKELSYVSAGQNVGISYITDTWTGSPNPGTIQGYQSVGWTGYYLLPGINCGSSSCMYSYISELRLNVEGISFKANKQYKLVATISSGDRLTFDFTRLNSHNTCYLGVNGSWTKTCESSTATGQYNGDGSGSITVYFTPLHDSNGIAYYIGDTTNTDKNSYLNLVMNFSSSQQGFRINSVKVYSVDDTDEELNNIHSSINSTNDKLNETNNNLTDIDDSINDLNSNINGNFNDLNSNINGNFNDLNSNINDSNSNGATDSAGSFFENFEDNDFGLSGIITAPLNTIKTITSNSCTPLNLTIPFVNKEMSLPCMTDIYEEYFGSFLDIYQIITFGIISYWVCVQIYAMVKDFKNPDKDEIEVMDL